MLINKYGLNSGQIVSKRELEWKMKLERLIFKQLKNKNFTKEHLFSSECGGGKFSTYFASKTNFYITAISCVFVLILIGSVIIEKQNKNN